MRTDSKQRVDFQDSGAVFIGPSFSDRRQPFTDIPDEEVQGLLGLVSSQFGRPSDYSAEQFSRALEQQRLARICQSLRKKRQSWRQIEAILRETETVTYSYVYLRDLVAKLEQGNGIWSFLSQKHRCGRPRLLTCREILEVLYLWTENTHRTCTQFCKDLKARWKLRGKKSRELPKYDAILSLVNSIQPGVVDVFQGRLEKYHSKYQLTAARFYPHVYHTWQFDEHHVKVVAKCSKTGRRFRPYLIGAIDCVSRLIPGAELLETKSTKERNLAAIYEAARPKDDPDDVIQGLPENIQYDNEAFFDNRSIHFTLGMLGIVPIHIKRNCPRENARIERFFRTIKNEFFSGFYSYVRRKCSRKQIYRDAICFDLLRKLFREWLYEYNYKRIHGAHDRLPIEVYLEQRNKIVNYDVIAEDIRPKFVSVIPRTVHHSGIHMPSGLTYNGEALAGLVGQEVHALEPLLYPEPSSIWIKLGDTDQPREVPRYEAADQAAGDAIRAAGRAQFNKIKAAKSTLKNHCVPLPQSNLAHAQAPPPKPGKNSGSKAGQKPKLAPPPAALPTFAEASSR